MSNLALNADAASLTPSPIVCLYVLDASAIGGGLFRFFAITQEGNTPVLWQGNEYTPLPLEARGFEFNGTGAPPRPSMVFGNVAGLFTSLVLNYDDLIGAKLTRKRTAAKYLDGQPTEDASIYLPDDIFFIERKVAENKIAVEFELATLMDVDDVSLPRRQIIANLCAWRYRGGECSYNGTAKGDADDNATGFSIVDRGEWASGDTYAAGDAVYLATTPRTYYWCYTGTPSGADEGPTNPTFWKKDECSKRVAGCKLRFGGNPFGLPFGGFPSSSRQS